MTEELEDAFVDVLEYDPCVKIRRAALALVADCLEWRWDSPIGPIHVGLRKKIIRQLPRIVERQSEDSEGLLHRGKALGRLGSIVQLNELPKETVENTNFRHAVVDGLAARELSDESKELLEVFVDDPDHVLRSDARELLED